MEVYSDGHMGFSDVYKILNLYIYANVSVSLTVVPDAAKNVTNSRNFGPAYSNPLC